ncbi:MAG: hypothetical protein J3K34DRAFT_414223 [Monoraphidium minutum]|nr:MAG: hypothetical protein J3K34DRAFT_414223 [Monoraphidium minutum]
MHVTQHPLRLAAQLPHRCTADFTLRLDRQGGAHKSSVERRKLSLPRGTVFLPAYFDLSLPPLGPARWPPLRCTPCSIAWTPEPRGGEQPTIRTPSVSRQTHPPCIARPPHAALSSTETHCCPTAHRTIHHTPHTKHHPHPHQCHLHPPTAIMPPAGSSAIHPTRAPPPRMRLYGKAIQQLGRPSRQPQFAPSTHAPGCLGAWRRAAGRSPARLAARTGGFPARPARPGPCLPPPHTRVP